MTSTTAFGHKSERPEAGRESSKRPVAHEPVAPTTCCGRLMENRLVHAHDRFGQTVFVAVWHCPACGRVVR
jgi:hypothetical protein